MDTKIQFSNKKPDKYGIWLWRVKGRDLIGVASLDGEEISELTWSPVRTYNVDVWWNEKLLETYHVGLL